MNQAHVLDVKFICFPDRLQRLEKNGYCSVTEDFRITDFPTGMNLVQAFNLISILSVSNQ